MECSFIMDNDSGYVSHNQESNLDSSSENVFKTRSCPSDNIYLSEDALLEKPLVENANSSKQFKTCDSFDSVINSSQESVKTDFSGLEDSGTSDTSFVIPILGPIVWSGNEKQEHISSSTSPEKPVGTSPKHKIFADLTNMYDQNTNQTVTKNTSSGKENIRPETPTKQYVNPQTSDVSPDLFADEEEVLNATLTIKSPIKKKVTPKDNKSVKDTKLLRNVQGSLSGVHPPPSVTMVQMGVMEMLDKIEKNKNLFWTACHTVTSDTGKSLLLDDKPECVQKRWPDIMKCRYHGLHYNRSKISEDFEHLCLKFAERYVGAETQSSCTVFESNPPSSQKRKMLRPRWGMKSPGRRLSHLARRRITFSSSNLQASNSSAILGSRTRQILVDARKLSVAKKSPRKTPKKTPSKSPFKVRKNTPSSSAKKKLAMRFRQMSGEFENVAPSTSSDQSSLSFKRALFTERDSGSLAGPMEKKSTKRALFSSPVKHSPNKKSPLKSTILDKKRKRTDSDECNPSKLARSASLDMQPKKSESTSFSRTLSDNFVSKPEELSDLHIKKLQWAVYESLRLQNVTPTHPQYKVFASVLARVTRRFLPNLRFEGRTSEKMLRIARYHSYAVVKGKTVDEIVNEYMRNKMKNQKPQGYIGIEEYNKLRSRTEGVVNKENVLQDKLNIIESMEKRREQAGPKTRYVHQNRIDQIKKVICFEEKET